MTKYYKYNAWYELASEKIKALYSDDALLFAGLIASCSPRMSLTRNYNIAKRIYDDFKKNPSEYYRWALNFRKEVYTKYIIWHSHYDNILRVLYHYLYDYKNALQLQGLKVNSFYQNLSGNYEEVTLDIWMARHYKHKKAFLSISDYKLYTSRIKRQAKRANLLPAHYQALIWTNVRAKAGYKPVFFHDIIK